MCAYAAVNFNLKETTRALWNCPPPSNESIISIRYCPNSAKAFYSTCLLPSVLSTRGWTMALSSFCCRCPRPRANKTPKRAKISIADIDFTTLIYLLIVFSICYSSIRCCIATISPICRCASRRWRYLRRRMKPSNVIRHPTMTNLIRNWFYIIWVSFL